MAVAQNYNKFRFFQTPKNTPQAQAPKPEIEFERVYEPDPTNPRRLIPVLKPKVVYRSPQLGR